MSTSFAVFQSTRWVRYFRAKNEKSRLQTWLNVSQMYVYEFVGCLGMMSKLYHKLCFAIQYFFHFNRWTVVATQSKKRSPSLIWSWKNTKIKWRKWEMDLRRYSIYIYIYIYIHYKIRTQIVKICWYFVLLYVEHGETESLKGVKAEKNVSKYYSIYIIIICTVYTCNLYF